MGIWTWRKALLSHRACCWFHMVCHTVTIEMQQQSRESTFQSPPLLDTIIWPPVAAHKLAFHKGGKCTTLFVCRFRCVTASHEGGSDWPEQSLHLIFGFLEAVGMVPASVTSNGGNHSVFSVTHTWATASGTIRPRPRWRVLYKMNGDRLRCCCCCCCRPPAQF